MLPRYLTTLRMIRIMNTCPNICKPNLKKEPHLRYGPIVNVNCYHLTLSSPFSFLSYSSNPSLPTVQVTAKMPTNMTLFSVNAILILSTDDRSRILTKYYSPPHSQPHASFPGAVAGGTTSSTSSSVGSNPYGSVKEQKAFEKGLLDKTNKQSGDVILYDGRVVVYKMEGDVMLYVVGGGDENEILLFGVVLALRDSLAILLKCVFSHLSHLSFLPSLFYPSGPPSFSPTKPLTCCFTSLFLGRQELDRQTDPD